MPGGTQSTSEAQHPTQKWSKVTGPCVIPQEGPLLLSPGPNTPNPSRTQQVRLSSRQQAAVLQSKSSCKLVNV